jgi:GTP-binding protein EngB required for normal cell division
MISAFIASDKPASRSSTTPGWTRALAKYQFAEVFVHCDQQGAAVVGLL